LDGHNHPLLDRRKCLPHVIQLTYGSVSLFKETRAAAFDARTKRSVFWKHFMSHAWWALVLLGWLSWGTGHAMGQQTTNAAVAAKPSRPLLRFDIERQPLSTAVKAFSEVTGQSLLVDERLLLGRVSPGVRGEFTADDALRRLLAGSGLRERYASDKAFTLEPIDARPDQRVAVADDGDAMSRAEAMTEAYAASLQAALEQRLCRAPGAHPGGYRLALQVWIDDAGMVGRVRLLGSTGQQERDGAIRQALDGLHVEMPPAGVEQPLTLLLLPASQSRPARCAAGG
jgi:hypothetical protein